VGFARLYISKRQQPSPTRGPLVPGREVSEYTSEGSSTLLMGDVGKWLANLFD
jgi:hypothetical protein